MPFLLAAQEPPEALDQARRSYELSQRGDLQRAIDAIREAVRLAPVNGLYVSALGRLLLRTGKSAEATEALGKARELLLEGNPVALENTSLDLGALLARQGQNRAGATMARDTARRFPKSARAQQMLGLFETRLQQNVAAAEAYSRALAIDPDCADCAAGLGIAQTRAGMTREAGDTFRTALAKFPADAVLHQAHGVLLLQLARDRSEPLTAASAEFEKALTLDPELPEPQFQLGQIALESGNATAALDRFAAAARSGQNDARLHWAIARAYRRLGRESEAAQHMRAFERLSAEETRIH
ncbi:MAG: tetratricopeptide repeat protein [Bryobacteraceae bacterium]